MARQPGRNASCHCGSGKKYKRCCLDRDRTQKLDSVRDGADMPAQAPGTLTLLVPTPGGMLVSRIPAASPLSEDEDQGDAAEAATRDAAALWGLPDFVYRPALRKVGSGTRELGDAVVIVGSQALVVQVKSRVGTPSNEERERGWLVKKAAEAHRQAKGTIRQLCLGSSEFENARGRTLTIDGNELSWLSVVVLDHPDVPAGVEPEVPADTVVLLRRDWEFLFEHLKSTHLVAQYLRRVAGQSIELGTEPVRYFGKATADAQAAPDPFPSYLLGEDGRPVSAPQLPLLAAGEDAERAGHLLFRQVMEDVATGPFDASREAERLHILGSIDRLPVAHRGDFGRLMMEALEMVLTADPGETLWRFRRMYGEDGYLHLGFGACSGSSQMHRDVFSTWVQLRHHQLQQLLGIEDLTTIGVLLTHRKDGQRPWDTTLVAVRGNVELTSDELAHYEELWDGDSRLDRP